MCIHQKCMFYSFVFYRDCYSLLWFGNDSLLYRFFVEEISELGNVFHSLFFLMYPLDSKSYI